jgi:predicted Holliday junction resolvase-like endonuclease
MKKKHLVIAFFSIACFLLILLIYFFIFSAKSYEQEIQERTKNFLENNPNANESYARDVAYHDLAIDEKNSKLCEKINTEWLKEDCLNYFKVNK